MFDSMEIQCKQSIRLCLMCQGRFAILQISITNYTPLYIFAFLFKIKQTSLHHNKNLQGVFFTCPSLKVRSMELVPPNKEPSLHSDYIEHHGSGQSQPPGSSFPARTLFEHPLTNRHVWRFSSLSKLCQIY